MPPYATTTAEEIILSPAPSLTGLRKTSPRLASSSALLTEPSPDAPVLTAFGLGKVLAVKNHQIVSIQLQSWTLASKSLVVCHLRRSDVTVLAPVPVHSMTVQQRIEYARLCKDLGVAAQQNGKVGIALTLHETALETTQSVLKDCATNDRPHLFLSMVKGQNHAASCALQLQLHRKARDSAKNALAVLDALERKGQAPTSPTSEPASAANQDAAALVGKVRLFGECRCKALIFVARSYLEYPKCKQRHRDLAKSNLDKASAVIKKYSTKEYTQIADMKPVLKQFVNHKRNITKYRAISKQQLVLSSSASTVATLDNTSYSTWFVNRRVWFADDAAQAAAVTSERSSRPTKTEQVGWSQKAASTIAYTGFVALGAFMIHQVVTSQRK